MTVINKSVFCRNLDGARLLGHPVYLVKKNKSRGRRMTAALHLLHINFKFVKSFITSQSCKP